VRVRLLLLAEREWEVGLTGALAVHHVLPSVVVVGVRVSICYHDGKLGVWRVELAALAAVSRCQRQLDGVLSFCEHAHETRSRARGKNLRAVRGAVT